MLWLAFRNGLLVEAVVVAVTAVVCGLIWSRAWPSSFGRVVAAPVWRRCRRRRTARMWPELCERVGLSLVDSAHGGAQRSWWTPTLSRLRWVSVEHRVLRGEVRVLAGQTVDDIAAVADRLAAACCARSCRVAQSSPNTATVTWSYGDPLTAPVEPLAVPEVPSLSGVAVGLREDGAPWRLRIAGTHLLVVGVTGAGKGSVIWSLLAGLAGGIRSGVVQVWAVDGKAGMELTAGRALFSRFATTVEDGVQLLEDAATVMAERAARMAGHARTHEATAEEPLLLVLVDEVALLMAYTPDRKLRERAEKALAALATQGRAPGVVLVAALQDPRKEVLGLRNLFPTKVAMRLDEKAQVDMVLGEGAREAGAHCHRIPESMPGVAFAKVDGVREPVQVRASYYSDEDIAELAATYAPSTVRPSAVQVVDEEPVAVAGSEAA
ncbi:FtsK/SpoIIIE domain-containing protein [Kineococcus sp. SYSU DK005]|uniref:FtsK/SpoIIIE domain-containing protein n=1 Tax=Kineococcus sp. SYSU DK005 TaxID=3383126 RepID=UPI003D7CA8F1